MSELGGLDIGMPDEGAGGASETISEAAAQRFAASQAAMQQIRKEEKRSKKRDDQVAKAIAQFLGDDARAHLFLLISRLVARDCPSIFIAALLSLIHDGCNTVVREYLAEAYGEQAGGDFVLTHMEKAGLDPQSSNAILRWITRMQLVLSGESSAVLQKLLVSRNEVDGSVLQLATFVLQDFLRSLGKDASFESLQAFSAAVLQATFAPLIAQMPQEVVKEEE